MKLPNGYGSVVKLSGNRRRPYAVRILTGYSTNETSFKVTPKYKYLEYFEKKKDALIYLAEYNAGRVVQEHTSYCNAPTFAEVFNMWLDYKLSLKKPPTDATVRNYKLVLNWCSDLVDKKFMNIRSQDIQLVANKYSDKSDSTVGMIRAVLNQMYKFALVRDLVDKNYAENVTFEWTNSEQIPHHPFTNQELQILWEKADAGISEAEIVLMMIYTGLRASEFIGIRTENIHLDEKYFIAGMKTKAGTNRTIPINDKVLPFFEKRYNPKRTYLINNAKLSKYTYGTFYLSFWTPFMEILKMNHTPHDTRHTFATLMDAAQADEHCIKLIMGHAISDLTKGVYTHKSLDALLKEINKI